MSVPYSELVKALREALSPVPFTPIPLHKRDQLSSSSGDWQKVLEWKGAPGRVFYIYAYDFDTDWPGATGTCSLRITSNGEEVVETDNTVVSTPTLYWFSLGQLQFKEVNPAGHLIFWAKSDGSNVLASYAEILGQQQIV